MNATDYLHLCPDPHSTNCSSSSPRSTLRTSAAMDEYLLTISLLEAVMSYFEDDVDTELIRKTTIFNRLVSHTTTTEEFLDTLKDFDDVNWHPDLEDPLLFHLSVFEDPKRVVALIDRGIDVNALDRNGVPAYWYMIPLETLRLLISANANVNFQLADGTTLLEHCARNDSKFGTCARVELLIDSGANVQPLFDSLYEVETIEHSCFVAMCLLNCGYSIDLERTLVYKLLNQQIPFNELEKCFLTRPGVPNVEFLTYHELLNEIDVSIEDLEKNVHLMKQLIFNAKENAARARKTLNDCLLLSTDLNFTICKSLFSYTDY